MKNLATQCWQWGPLQAGAPGDRPVSLPLNPSLFPKIREYTSLFFFSSSTEQILNQKSDSRENLSHFFYGHVQNTPSIRHFDAIQPPSWQVSPALLPFRRHLPATKADVLLTFCTYKVLYAKKNGGKNYRGNLPGGVLMATMRCARRHARGH